MRLDLIYTLSALWGGPGVPQTCPVIAPAGHEAAATTAFVNVNVVPMDTERVLTKQTVVIEDGKITALGPTDKVTIPAGATRIDGQGKYLMPGLGNMHPHGRLHETTLARPDWRYRFFVELAGGVTTMRHIVGGELTPEQMWRYFTTTDVPSPRMYIAPKIQGADNSAPGNLDSVAAKVAAAKAAGYHHIGMQLRGSAARSDDPRTYAFLDSLIAAARRAGLPIADHDSWLPLDTLRKLGATGGSTEHLYAFWGFFWGDKWDQDWPTRPAADVPFSKVREAAAAVQRSGLWITPTLSCTEYKYPMTSANREVLRRLTKTLQDAGVGLLLAGDDGGDVHDELAALVRAGLSPYQALVTGTRNVAGFYKMDSTGTVAVGKRADLVLLSGNPLEDVGHVREPAGVMIDGRWLDRAALDRGLLAEPSWLRTATDVPAIRHGLTSEQRRELRSRTGKFQALTESLATAQAPEADRLRRQAADELGAIRALLASERHAVFDAVARIWLREQARQGHQVTVPGMTP